MNSEDVAAFIHLRCAQQPNFKQRETNMAVTKKSAISKNSKKPAKKSSPKATAPTAAKLRTAFGLGKG